MTPTEPASSSSPDNLPPDSPWWARWIQAEARDAWKWSNTYLVGVLGAIPVAYEAVPGLKAIIPPAWAHWTEGALALVTFFNLLRRKT